MMYVNAGVMKVRWDLLYLKLGKGLTSQDNEQDNRNVRENCG